MIKNGVNKVDIQAKAIQKILITQPRPESDKSPYFELSRKYSVDLDFYPFIRLEGIPGPEVDEPRGTKRASASPRRERQRIYPADQD